jgi:hypothetical protein
MEQYMNFVLKDLGHRGPRFPYKEPTPELKEIVSVLTEKIYKGQDPSIELDALKMTKNTLPGGIDVYEPTKSTLMTCTILHRPQSSSNLLLESLHNGADGLHIVMADLLASDVDYKIMILNFLHSHAVSNKKHSDSDMCHNPNNYASVIQRKIYDLNPNTLTLQFHGMVGAKNFQMLVVNIFNARYTTGKSGCTMLAKACMNNFSKFHRSKLMFATKNELPFENDYRKFTANFAHNSNVQGRILNVNKDSGRFIHLEVASLFRGNKKFNIAARKCLFDSINDMMKQWDSYKSVANSVADDNNNDCDKRSQTHSDCNDGCDESEYYYNEE